jgi:hypothetical protein
MGLALRQYKCGIESTSLERIAKSRTALLRLELSSLRLCEKNQLSTQRRKEELKARRLSRSVGWFV